MEHMRRRRRGKPRCFHGVASGKTTAREVAGEASANEGMMRRLLDVLSGA
jgi:hypothetical protein